MILEQLLREFKIEGLSEEDKDHWNHVWHRLKPWPDSVAGLARLKKKYVIAPFIARSLRISTVCSFKRHVLILFWQEALN
jgi:hypothetical protein